MLPIKYSKEYFISIFTGCNEKSHMGKETESLEKSSVSKKDGISYFDINFVANDQEYEYEIDAVTGEIIKWDKETEDD